MGRSSCEDCRRAFEPTRWDTPAEKKKKAGGPPCAACRPETHPDNATACRIYLRCARQLIVGPMGGAIDINLQAVELVMHREGIPESDRNEVMEQVHTLAGIVIREQAAEAEAKREAERDKQGR